MLNTLETPLYVLLCWEDAGRAARINGLTLAACPTSLLYQAERWRQGWECEDARIGRLEESAGMVMGEQR